MFCDKGSRVRCSVVDPDVFDTEDVVDAVEDNAAVEMSVLVLVSSLGGYPPCL